MPKMMMRFRKVRKFFCGGVVWGLISAFSAGATESSGFEQQAGSLLSCTTLDEKIGQRVQVDMNGLKDKADAQKYFPGSMLSGGSSDPSPDNRINSWLRAVNEYESWALKTRLKIPRNALPTSCTVQHTKEIKP